MAIFGVQVSQVTKISAYILFYSVEMKSTLYLSSSSLNIHTDLKHYLVYPVLHTVLHTAQMPEVEIYIFCLL